MNGGLTCYELEEIRWKARRWDAAMEWLTGRCDHERAIAVRDVLVGRGQSDPRPARPDLEGAMRRVAGGAEADKGIRETKSE